MAQLARLMNGFEPSKISEIFALANRLKADGRDIIDLSAGEPDFDTPEAIKRAGCRAIDAGETKYTDVDGTPALKRAVREKFARDNELDYDLDQIVIGAGAKPLLFHALQAIVDPGDEVIVPTPCWPSYRGMIRLAGGLPVMAPTSIESGFRLTPEDLRAVITPRSKALMLNAPGNPSGAAYDAAALKAIAAVLADHPNIWVVTDDLYEHVMFDGRRFETPAAAAPEIYDRTLTVNGVSKGHAMTGWRIGFAGGPRDLVGAMVRVMTQTTGNPPTMSQAAAIEALTGSQAHCAEWAARFQARRDLAAEMIDTARGLRCALPDGAFYLFPNCSALMGSSTPDGKKIDTSADLARYLLEDAGVAVVPGGAFECDPYFRLSFAAADDLLREGCHRIQRACAALR